MRIVSGASGNFPTTGVFSLGGVEVSNLLIPRPAYHTSQG